jgi:hypothetical protein
VKFNARPAKAKDRVQEENLKNPKPGKAELLNGRKK